MNECDILPVGEGAVKSPLLPGKAFLRAKGQDEQEDGSGR